MDFRSRDFVFFPTAIWRHHSFLSDAQYWDAEKRRGWIQERLERTLVHAVDHVPYYKRTIGPYRSRFGEMIDALDLSELPVLTKQDIKTHYDELCSGNYDRNRAYRVATSGSTGTPTKFLVDRESNISHFAAIWTVLNWVGYSFGDRFADMTAHVLKNDKLFRYDPRLNCLRLSTFNFKREYVPLYIDKITRFNPALIKAFPSAIDLFCRWIKDLEIGNFSPKIVLTCAETLHEHQKKLIEEVLQCSVFDFYNQNERAALISTCPAGTYHVHENYSFVEFVSTNGNETDSSAPQSILTTTFHNQVMPLIRYDTSDLVLLTENSYCPCGRTYKTVDKIIGRIEDVVVTPDGRVVGGLGAAFKNASGIRQCQLVQDNIEELNVRIVKASSFTQDDINTVERELRYRVGNDIKLVFQFVERISPAAHGKIKFVISTPGKEILSQLS